VRTAGSWMLGGALLGAVGVVLLGLFGGTVGRVIFAAFAWGMAGLFLPLIFAKGPMPGRAGGVVLIVLCGLCAVGGAVMGP
jgi:hypothetical protein